VEAFLAELGFKIMSIRATTKNSERSTIRHAFNRKTDPSEILITSIRVGSSSVNLYGACLDIVFMDVPPNSSEMMQSIGRLFRLG